MMISPEEFVEQHKNDTLEELIMVRRHLEKDLVELEKKLFYIGVDENDPSIFTLVEFEVIRDLKWNTNVILCIWLNFVIFCLKNIIAKKYGDI